MMIVPSCALIKYKDLFRRRQTSRQGEALHSMDIGLPGEEVSVEQARELLIAISYSLPDKAPDSAVSPTSNYSNEAVVANWDSAEELRSELISISSLQSPKSYRAPMTEDHNCVCVS